MPELRPVPEQAKREKKPARVPCTLAHPKTGLTTHDFNLLYQMDPRFLVCGRRGCGYQANVEDWQRLEVVDESTGLSAVHYKIRVERGAKGA
jgi:hypothetical protein